MDAIKDHMLIVKINTQVDISLMLVPVLAYFLC